MSGLPGSCLHGDLKIFISVTLLCLIVEGGGQIANFGEKTL